MSSNENTIDDPVGSTSIGAAMARAVESTQPNALFQDPFASIYAGQFKPQNTETFSRLDKGMIQSMMTYTAVRTRFFDDLLEKTLPTIKQIVILACGGDFRPYRLSLAKNSPDAEFYLLDVPEVIAYRQKCLEKSESLLVETNCKVVEIACNLANEEWPSKLRQHGFNPDNATFWLAEGLLPYLTEQDIRQLFSQIRKLSTKQSHIVFDVVSTEFQKAISIIRSVLDNEEEIHRMFTELGCEDIECMSFEKLGAMYGREVLHNLTFIITAKLSSQDVPSKN